MLSRSLILLVSSRPWFERFIRNSRITQPVVRRFIAGNKREDAIRSAEELVKKGFTASLDYLGEHTTRHEEAEAAFQEYMHLVEDIARSPYGGGSAPEKINVSVKLSQLGHDFEEAETKRRLITLLDVAARNGNFIRIDMESSPTVERTLRLVREVWPERKNVGVVLQAMLHRTKQDIEEMIGMGIRVRLVKGAYLEPPEVALQKKRDVDAAYLEYAKKLLSKGNFPAIATHDERIIEQVIGYCAKNNIGKEKFEFQMLFGVKRKLQAELVEKGYNLRIYIPYGMSWYPYFVRRLAERPANLWFFIRSLFGK
ncbi:MAG TPA: proline dehydrogenase family protein [Fimbriimonadales bacterium]|nr:proline dehydrogenase family protein [Fimbriimonadales bacterium]